MENRDGGGSVPAHDVTATDADSVSPRRSWATFLKSRDALLLAGASLIGAVFLYLQFSTASICCGDFDAYYHFRWSRMLWDGMMTGNFPPAFNALPFTTLNPRDYVDHHFLFHVMQIPFTWFSDFQLGAKIGTWLFASSAVFACYWMIVRYRLSYPLLWLVGILGSAGPFLYRIQMGKAMSVSIVLLIIGIHLLFQRKYLWLLPTAFVFALTYDMVYLLWAAAGFWLIVTVWGERSFNRAVKWAFAACILVVVGTALGYVINPYFPHNVQLTYQHLLMKVTTRDFSTAVGGEWYPYNTWEFLGNCGVALLAMVAGYVAFRDSARREHRHAFFFLLFATALMIVNMRWRRFSEYWPPFAVLFAAFALHPLILNVRARFGLQPVAGEESASSETAPARVREGGESARAWEFVVVGSAFVLLAAPMVWYTHITSKDIAGMQGPERFRGGAEWLARNVPPGEPVFNSDWDDFPKLFFYDPHRPYIAGLDPTYLLDKDPELMKHYERIGRGEEEDPGPIIREKFCLGEGPERRCTRYVITDHEHERFFNNALDSGWFDVVYEDDDVSILRVRDAKGEPPPDNLPPGMPAPDDAPDAQTEGSGL